MHCSHAGDLTDLLKEIMTEARKLTKAERCSLFLLESEQQELVAKVFDGLPAEEVSTLYFICNNITTQQFVCNDNPHIHKL